MTALSRSDLDFIRLMAPERFDDVCRAYEVRPPHWGTIVDADSRISITRSLAAYARLLFRVATAYFRRDSAQDECDAICCEYAAGLADRREAFFERFAPGMSVEQVTLSSRLASPTRGIPFFRVLFGLLPLLLRADSQARSVFAGRYVRVAEYCLVGLTHAARSRQKAAYLLRMYHAHTPVMSAFLMEQGVTSHLITSTGRLVMAELAIPANSMKLTHPYQLYCALQATGPRAIEHLALWGPFETVEMEQAYRGVDRDGDRGVIGVYTQGFWLRQSVGSIQGDAAAQAVARESEFMDIILEYVTTREDVTALIFMHPMERRHFKATGELGPWPLLAHPSAEVVTDLSQPSNTSFQRAGVGLTTFSTIGYDRLYAGFRTLFYRGDVQVEDDEVVSPFGELFFRDRQGFLEAIDTARSQTAVEFETCHFGGSLREWRPDDGMLRQMAEFSPEYGASDSGREA